MITWPFFALVTSLLMAVMVEVNHHYKANGLALTVLSAGITMLLLIPVALWVEWPTDTLFYVLSLLVGGCLIFTDMLVFNTAARFGGRATVFYYPLRILFVFGLWYAYSPGDMAALLETPLRFGMVMMCLLGVVGSLLWMRRNKLTMTIFWHILPVVAIIIPADLMAKVALEHTTHWSAGPLYTFLICMPSLVLGGGWMLVNKVTYCPHWQDKETWMAALWVGVVAALMVSSSSLALRQVPNPAYLSCVVMLNMVWLMMYNRVRGVPDHASPYAALVMSVCVGLLVILVT